MKRLLMTLLITISVLAIPATLIGRTPDPAAWALTARPPATLAAFRAIPAEYRAALRKTLPVADRARLWTEQISEFVARRPHLTADQRRLVTFIQGRITPEWQAHRDAQAATLTRLNAKYAGTLVTTLNRDEIQRDLRAGMRAIYPIDPAAGTCAQIPQAFTSRDDIRMLTLLGEGDGPVTRSLGSLVLSARVAWTQQFQTSAQIYPPGQVCKCNDTGWCEGCPLYVPTELWCWDDKCGVQETPECGCPWEEPTVCLKRCVWNIPSGGGN